MCQGSFYAGKQEREFHEPVLFHITVCRVSQAMARVGGSLRLLALVTACGVVSALDNGLALLPGLGWNSDYCIGCDGVEGRRQLSGFQNEAYIHDIARFLIDLGLAKLGYTNVNMDASWDLPARSATGDLQPDPAQWPSGLAATVDFVHSLGLGFGLYGDRGTLDCAKNPGQLGFEAQDAAFFAKTKIDWFKSDSCYASGDQQTAIAEYGKMRDALNATGRPIWFALCGWLPWYAPVGATLGNSWRIGEDTGGGWANVLSNAASMLSLGQFAGPGKREYQPARPSPHSPLTPTRPRASPQSRAEQADGTTCLSCFCPAWAAARTS